MFVCGVGVAFVCVLVCVLAVTSSVLCYRVCVSVLIAMLCCGSVCEEWAKHIRPLFINRIILSQHRYIGEEYNHQTS